MDKKEMTIAAGFDVGSYNFVISRREADGSVKSKKEVNAFLEIPLDDPHAFSMLSTLKVPMIKRDKSAFIIGEAAATFAYAFQAEMKRPMRSGCVNPAEKSAFQIMSAMIHSMIGDAKDNEVIYYSVPANAVNQETDVDYHQKVLDQIFKSYNKNGKKVRAFPLNEGLALIYAELKDKHYTGLSLSCGSGMLNFCYSIFSRPVVTFSMVNSGDWLDKQVSMATGEVASVINREKTKVDLLAAPTNMIERAVQSQYRILIEKVITGIKSAILKSDHKVRTENPLDFVIGGGVASPNGFIEIFKEVLAQSEFPIPVGEIIKPKDHLYAVSRGCLCAAENASL